MKKSEKSLPTKKTEHKFLEHFGGRYLKEIILISHDEKVVNLNLV